MNEQTVYRVPGNRHSSRQASVELMYGVLSGDTTFLKMQSVPLAGQSILLPPMAATDISAMISG